MGSDSVGRPIIGITTYIVAARFDSWNQDCALVPAEYVDAVHAAGGRPVLLPPFPDSIDALDIVDGLLLTGGSDIDPAAYGHDAHPMTVGTIARRDDAELPLAREAVRRGMPTLGICRGSQVLNVACGGALVQHLPEALGDDRHKEVPGVYARHHVSTGEGSLLARILGGEIEVKSHHHQGFDQIGEGLRATAWADDGTVEGVEAEASFALGVLWHPEAMGDGRLFEALVHEARGYAAKEPGPCLSRQVSSARAENRSAATKESDRT